jgi:hypothetical protein
VSRLATGDELSLLIVVIWILLVDCNEYGGRFGTRLSSQGGV